MDSRQIELVRETWEMVLGISETVTELFYNRLFEIDESTRVLFEGTDMKEQGVKLIRMLDAAVKGLTDLDALVPVVQKLGERHAGYQVTEQHYDSVGAALLWTLEQGLGDAFTEEVKEAWTETYTLVAGVMKEAAASAKTAAVAAS